MSIATAMYHSGKDTLHKVSRKAEDMPIPKSIKQRRLHKAFLRYHDPKNWPLLRDALNDLGRNDLIGNGKHHLIPSYQPKGTVESSGKVQQFKTKYTGLDNNRNEKKFGKNKTEIKQKTKQK